MMAEALLGSWPVHGQAPARAFELIHFVYQIKAHTTYFIVGRSSFPRLVTLRTLVHSMRNQS